MERIDDATLLEELKRRLEENRIAVDNLRAMTQNLEAVNEKLRRSEALKSDFLSNIRNEINNPLASILGLARQISDRKPEAEAVRTMAALIHQEAFDLDFQLRNIFIAAELEAGDAGLSTARVDVGALVRGLIADFQQKAREKKVSISFDPPETGGAALAFITDPDKLHRILANLLANAIEFNREGKQVSIRTSREGDMMHISITDEGPGIPNEARKKVFDRFVQLDSGSRKRHRGHGLGLSIAKALAERLNGGISLAGQEGSGCTFTLSITELRHEGPVEMTSGDGNELIFDGGAAF